MKEGLTECLFRGVELLFGTLVSVASIHKRKKEVNVYGECKEHEVHDEV